MLNYWFKTNKVGFHPQQELKGIMNVAYESIGDDLSKYILKYEYFDYKRWTGLVRKSFI
jgi:hypothetical protein